MADPSSPTAIWEWMDWLWGFALGAITAIGGMVGWINPRLKSIDQRILEESQTVNARIVSVEKLVLELEGEHNMTTALYQSIVESMRNLDKKTEEQTKLLYDLVGQLRMLQHNHNGGRHE